MASDFIELTFKGERKLICANPKEINFGLGDYAAFDVENGVDMGQITKMGRLVSITGPEDQITEISRKATEDDITHFNENRSMEEEAFKTCRQKIDSHDLIMKLVDVEYQFDRNKITFYFTSDKRVDFRSLVKDLAAKFRTRIELRQIGVRDEARRVGGFGMCGHKLCCTKFIEEFAPISTQFAKDQNLSMNPSKLSGVCGRLMCCLAFEKEMYCEFMTKFPARGFAVETSKGKAIVEKVNIFKDLVTLRYIEEDGIYEDLHLKEYNGLIKQTEKPETVLTEETNKVESKQ